MKKVIEVSAIHLRMASVCILICMLVYVQVGLVMAMEADETLKNVRSVKELFQVSVIQNGGFHQLFWVAHQDDEISGFTVEVAVTEGLFEYWQSIPVASANSLASYTVKLKKSTVPCSYRLKVLFKDQQVLYSESFHVGQTDGEYYPLFFEQKNRLVIFQTDRSQGPMEMELYTEAGQLIETFSLTNEYVLPTAKLKNGTYMIKYHNEATSGVWRFVKQ